MRSLARVAALTMLASACGGGGGGGGGSGNGVSVSPTSVTFTAMHGGSIPASQQLAITVTDSRAAYVGAAWQSGDPGWLTVSDTAGTGSPYRLALTVNDTSLAAATYRATLSVGIADARGNVLAYRDVSITYVVTPEPPALQTDADTLAFSSVNGRDIPAQTISVSMNNGAVAPWTASTGASWLVLANTSGTTPGALGVTVDPSRGPLASGTYTSTVTLTASHGGDTLTKTIPVTLTLSKATLTVTPAALVGNGSLGRAVIPSPSSLQIGLDTGARTYPWTATQDHPWIGLDALSGTVGGTPTTVRTVWDRTGLSSGSYTGTVVVQATVNGDTLTAQVPVTLNLDAHLLLSDDDGVAFASMPGLSSLTRTLHVRDNFGLTTPFAASSDQTWLSVTPSGTTHGDLVLTADPTHLSADAIHYATVTVTSSDASIERAEHIQVGLWVGSAAPAASASIPGSFADLVLDPIRPYAYVHNGGSLLSVYNVFTGILVTTVDATPATLGRMAAASDGSRLFLTDTAHQAIAVVNLSDLALATPIDTGTSVNTYLASTRTNGKRLLLTGTGRVFDALSGAPLGTPFSGGYYGNAPIAVNLTGNRFATQDTGISPSSFNVYLSDWTAAGGQFIVSKVSWGSGGSNGQDLALDASGHTLYTANGAPYAFGAFDVNTSGAAATALPSLAGAAYPDNVEVARDGRVFCASNYGAETADVWIYDPAGQYASRTLLLGSPKTRQLAVSGDGLRLAALTASALKLVTVAP